MPIHDWTRVNACIFHDFRHEWISTTRRALNSGLLPPDYYALAEPIPDNVEPDLLTLHISESSTASRKIGPATQIVIHQSSSDLVAAVMAIVSPENKASRTALLSFVQNTLELLNTGIHLLVVDLLPPGPRDPQGIHAAIWWKIAEAYSPLQRDKPLSLVAYTAEKEKSAYLEPMAVGDALPNMPLFLKPDCYVPVPLETTYQAAWTAVPQRWQRVLEGESS